VVASFMRRHAGCSSLDTAALGPGSIASRKLFPHTSCRGSVERHLHEVLVAE